MAAESGARTPESEFPPTLSFAAIWPPPLRPTSRPGCGGIEGGGRGIVKKVIGSTWSMTRSLSRRSRDCGRASPTIDRSEVRHGCFERRIGWTCPVHCGRADSGAVRSTSHNCQMGPDTLLGERCFAAQDFELNLSRRRAAADGGARLRQFALGDGWPGPSRQRSPC